MVWWYIYTSLSFSFSDRSFLYEQGNSNVHRLRFWWQEGNKYLMKVDPVASQYYADNKCLPGQVLVFSQLILSAANPGQV